MEPVNVKSINNFDNALWLVVAKLDIIFFGFPFQSQTYMDRVRQMQAGWQLDEEEDD